MITKKNTKPNYWNAAIRHLSAADPVISRVISKYKHNNFLTVTNTPFVTLFKIILGQQISIEAAKSIENRIKKNIRQITPNNFLKHDVNNLRAYGLSHRKIKYISGVAKIIKSEPNFFKKISMSNDADAIKQLTTLYGLGPWSAEMFLIFQYNRRNILPLDDIGLINSFCNNYKINRQSFSIEIMKYKNIWNPYCTVATWYLWRDIDEDVVQY
tara:strand:+ start:2138 stop:2776 length:639 start_codon:yes stop_codon:yes gene_type:complete